MRKNRLDWPDYNMLQACVVALRSPDPNTIVGCYICSQDNRPISMGYNGTPKGVNPDNIPWDRQFIDEDGNEHLDKTKYLYVIHSEANSILSATKSLIDSQCYITLHPCADCMKLLIQAGIKKVYYLTNPYENTPSVRVAKWMAETADIKLEQHIWNRENLQINISQLLKTISPE